MFTSSMLYLHQRSCLTTAPNCHHFETSEITRIKVTAKQAQHILKRNHCKRLKICANNNNNNGRKDVLALRATHKLSGREYGIIQPAATLQNEITPSNPEGFNWTSIKHNLNSLCLFIRPYVLVGSTMSDLSPKFFAELLKAIVPVVLMNIYVAGFNQLYDVELDKVNKPHYPLASGDLSMKAGTTIVATSILMSLGMGVMLRSPPLLAALLTSFALGTAYSIDLPYLRWKKHPFLALMSTVIVRAISYQIGFSIHIQRYVLGKPVIIPRSLVFAVASMCFFYVVIGVIKDIPDAEGDREF